MKTRVRWDQAALKTNINQVGVKTEEVKILPHVAGLNCMRVRRSRRFTIVIYVYIYTLGNPLPLFFSLSPTLDYPICPYICLFFYTFFQSTFLGGGNHVKKVARQAPPPFYGSQRGGS